MILVEECIIPSIITCRKLKMPVKLPLSVFCSYAHADKRLREDVEKSLAQVKREGLIEEIWSDREILPGEAFAEVIDDRIEESDLILFLVSRNFLASSYCMGVEVERALERKDSDGAQVIPIILRDCDWRNASFGHLQALPDQGNPIQHWRLKDTRLLQVAGGIRKVAQSFSSNPNPSRGKRRSNKDIPVTLPYLCDRGPQEGPLETALEAHLHEKPLRAFVCVVPGNETEEHSGYRSRLLDYSLPRILQLGAERKVNVHVPLEWPRLPRDRASARQAISANLAHVLNCASSRIVETLFMYGSPIVVSCELLSEDWRDGGQIAASAFFEFWNSWPDLPLGRNLLIFLFIKYQRNEQDGVSPRSKYPRVDGAIKLYLKTLSAADYPNISISILPDLLPIARTAVETWMEHPHMTRFCPDVRNHEDWRSEIYSLYKNRQEIPMAQLAPALRVLLGQC